jgi:hypothetical protein
MAFANASAAPAGTTKHKWLKTLFYYLARQGYGQSNIMIWNNFIHNRQERILTG